MKTLLLTLVLCLSLLGQNTGGIIEGPKTKEFAKDTWGRYEFLRYAVYRNPDGSKTLLLQVRNCPESWDEEQEDDECSNEFSGAQATAFTQATVDNFHIAYAEKTRHVEYQATAQTNPQMIVLDPAGNSRVYLQDLKTFVISHAVPLPASPQIMGVRPTQSGISREVWTPRGGIPSQLIVTNMEAARIEANIPTDLTLQDELNPVAILFSNSGKTAYYLGNANQDADGYGATLLTFDADARKRTSTVRLPLPYIDSALMAPDGLTIYMLQGTFRGKVLYYDVLTGTADLSAPFENIVVGKPLMHPDGNRIFFLDYLGIGAGSTVARYAISVFDTAQRKVVNTFPINFTGGGATLKLHMTQDGSHLYILSDKGEVQIIDPRTGAVTRSYNVPATTFTIFTVPVMQ